MMTRGVSSVIGSCLVVLFALGGRSFGQTPASSTPKADPSKRIWVRGCPVDSDCRRQLQAGLREFEVKLGSASVKSPWLDATRLASNHGVKPSSIDPSLAWLDNINMPDLPIRWTPQLVKYLEFYKNDPRGRAIMSAWLIDQGKYEAMIVSALRGAKLPEDLLYICMIESSFNPHEYSRAGASGLWQFMPSGARIYGLQMNRWIDERNDPVKSTKAVTMYFADLHHRFRNWHLAMGAFNQGYNGMLRSLAKYNTNDYWQLLRYENALPRDTALYVPKALAAAIIGRNRALFGFDKLKLERPLVSDEVMVPRSTTLATLARAAGVSVRALRQLNPQLRLDRTPPGVTNFVVRLPRGSGTRFSRNYDRFRADWDRYADYTVSHGERLIDIAAMHGISVPELRRLNSIERGATAGSGDVLLVPRMNAEAKRHNLERARRRAALRRGDGLAREPILVAVPDKELRVAGKRRVFYRVVKGDNLRQVARAFRIRPSQLAAWNNIDVDGHLYPRMVLQVFVDPELSLRRARIKVLDPDEVQVVTRGSDEHLRLAELRNGRERISYRATRRESLATIGQKFGLTARDLARINRCSFRRMVKPGESIVVYRVVDARRSRKTARQARRLELHRERIAKKKAEELARKRAAELARKRAERERRAAERRRKAATRRRKARRDDKRATRSRRKRVAERKRSERKRNTKADKRKRRKPLPTSIRRKRD